MKTIVLSLSVAILLMSCVSYQYLTITPKVPPSAKKQITADSLEIDYNFNGYKALLTLNIKNSSTAPIIINWKKSSLIINGQAASLYNSNAPVAASGMVETQPVNNNAYAYINGSIALPEGADFIPPSSAITKKTIYTILIPVNMSFAKSDTILVAGDDMIKQKFSGKHFEYNSSPCKIRIYITCQKRNGTESIFENEFYVSKILSSFINPNSMGSSYSSMQPVIYL
jgi:hypothetical protein